MIPKFRILVGGLLVASALGLSNIPLALADFDSGFAAYGKGDFATALQQWHPAAEAGDPHAQHMLGFLYARGEGVPIMPTETIKWWRRAAEQSHPPAQMSLGVLYRKGLGVARNPAEAAKWIGRAAEAGFADAQVVYGVMHAKGEGVSRDVTLAYMWLDLAANAKGLEGGALWHLADPFLLPSERRASQRLERKWVPGTEPKAVATPDDNSGGGGQ